MNAVSLLQIFYSAETQARVGEGFIPLNNSHPARSDWFEIWPILDTLNHQDWSKSVLLGVFSPRFSDKTGLGHSHVTEFISADEGGSDVYLFSPQPDMGAFFLNVFEQAETFDPGFIETAQQVVNRLGFSVELRGLIMDSRNVVFSNYFVANKCFWARWREVVDRLVDLADGGDALGESLRRKTSYPGGVQVKVFIAERIASLILATEDHWKVKAHNPFGFAWSATRFRDQPHRAYVNDALKIAFRETGRSQYLDAFAQIRQRFIDREDG